MSFEPHLCKRHPNPGLLVGICLVLGALLSVGSVLAAAPATTQEIHVLSDRWSISFPDKVDFVLEVEGGEAPIEEVRIYLQVPGQSVTSYGYLDFEAGRRVRALYSLPTGGPDYVPPGTEIEYYYVIRDAEGATVTTERESFLYEDTRYTWQMTQMGPLELYWHGGSRSDVERVAPGVESTLRRIESVLHIESQRPLKGFIYNSQEEAALAFPALSATLQRERLFAGYAFPDKGLFLGVGMAHYLLVHECAHLYLGQLLGPAHSLLPAWVDEGFAVYMQEPSQSYSTFAARLQGQDPLPLRAMGALPGQAAQIRLFYDQAPAVVGYLLENYDSERFRDFLDQFRHGLETDEALQAAYGFGVEELDGLWRKGVAGTPVGRRLDARFWAVVLPSAIIVLAMLATMVGYAVRYVRQMRRGDEEP